MEAVNFTRFLHKICEHRTGQIARLMSTGHARTGKTSDVRPKNWPCIFCLSLILLIYLTLTIKACESCISLKMTTFNKCANERKLKIKPSCFLKFLNKNETNKQKLKDNCKSRI